MAKSELCGSWPGGFIYGDRVVYRRRIAKIAKAHKDDVPENYVPICFGSDETKILPVPSGQLFLASRISQSGAS